jgi:hypothetical protein
MIDVGACLQTRPGFSFTMPKRRKRFSAATEARRRARLVAGPPPAEKIIPDKRLKPPKHKRHLTEDES